MSIPSRARNLAFAGQPYLLDAAAMMDFQMSGLEIPAATTQPDPLG